MTQHKWKNCMYVCVCVCAFSIFNSHGCRKEDLCY